MGYLIGRGRNARETYPGRSGGFVVGDLVRLYAADAPDDAGEVEYFAQFAEMDWGAPFARINILVGGGVVVAPEDYPIGRFSAKRIVIGAGPITGDNPIQYDLMQSVDDGVTFTPLAPTMLYQPDERGTKNVSIGLTVPSGAVLAVRGTYPTNYTNPGALPELIYFVIEVGAAA